MIAITARPQTVRTDGTTCTFSHGYNPVYIDMQRQDTTITGVFNAGSSKMGIVVADNTIFEAGKNAYIYIDHDLGTYSGVYEVLIVQDIIIGMVTFQVIVIDDTFQAFTGITGFANTFTRLNYKIFVKLNVVGSGLTTERSFSPDDTGLCRLYLNSMFEDLFPRSFDIDYTVENQRIDDMSLQFSILTKQQWIGYTTESYAAQSGSWRAVKSVEQIGEDNRMVDYEVYYITALQYSQAKFLTAFEEPVYFVGLPFSLSFLKGTTAASVVKARQQTATTKTTITASIGVNVIPITPNTLTNYFNFWLETGTALSDTGYAVEYSGGYTK